MITVVAVSGGKDSSAAWSWAKRHGLDPVPIYDDTLWEWEGHAAYLDELEKVLGPIRARTQPPYSFVDGVRLHKIFPRRLTARWCTQELKIEPFRAELDKLRDETGDDVQVIVGVRAEESKTRAKLPPREYAKHYDCDVWRPILNWTLADVIAEHHRAGIPIHPLYLEGAERVGCFPCINAGKDEIALVARLQPSRIDDIEAIESENGGTMFVIEETAKGRRARGAGKDDPRKVIPTPIRKMIEWAKTDRSGNYVLVRAPSGCARWGICEVAPAEADRRGTP